MSLKSTPTQPGCDYEIPGFPLQWLTNTLLKKSTKWGGDVKTWIHSTVYPEKPYLQDHIGSAKKSSALFPGKKKSSKKQKSRGEKAKKKMKQTTGMQLHSISCCMLFLSQGLYRCTNWVEVGNGRESKPVFPSTLGLMRATCRNVDFHSTPPPHGLLHEGK